MFIYVYIIYWSKCYLDTYSEEDGNEAETCVK